MAAIQQAIISSLGRDFTMIAPSFVFRLFPLSFFLWLGTVLVVALMVCNARTRAAWDMMRRMKSTLQSYVTFPEMTFAPCLVCFCLLLGMLVMQYSDQRHNVALQQILHLSRTGVQEEIQLSSPVRSQGILIVSNATESVGIPHDTSVANVTVFGKDQRFESFTVKLGRDTSEIFLEKPDIKVQIAHGRAALYRSWNFETDDVISVIAHDYYTKFFFLRPLRVQKITFKFLDPEPEEQISDVALHIKEIILLE
jgi:hypothetical protein